MMRVGELFAGIGGFGLGFQRAGFEVTWQVEIDEWCQKVLTKNFPESDKFRDIRDVGKHNLSPVDVICGGFPCQPFSAAGKRGGATDDRYLWPEMLRIIDEVRPSWVIGENVPGILSLVLPASESDVVSKGHSLFEDNSLLSVEQEYAANRVVGDLESIGYDVQVFVIPACAIGAPHIRNRVWFVAHNNSAGMERSTNTGCTKEGRSGMVEHSGGCAAHIHQWGDWDPRTGVGRSIHGIPNRMDRIKALGNAVVPQIPEMFARFIMEIETQQLRKAA